MAATEEDSNARRNLSVAVVMSNAGNSASADHRPTVSVVMANYNNSAHLMDAIQSVQKQSLQNLELIVSDDASRDDSVQIVKSMMTLDARIRLLQDAQNTGPAAARNRAFSVAKGEWIAVVDSDDLMHPERLRTLIDLGERDAADIVADDQIHFFSDNIGRPRPLLTGGWARAPFWVSAVDFIALNNMYGPRPSLGYLKPIFRRSLLDNFSVRYDEALTIGEDYDFILRLLLLGRTLRVYPLLLYFYRKHSSSTSHRMNKPALVALAASSRKLLAQLPTGRRTIRAVLHNRLESIRTAMAFELVIDGLKERTPFRAIVTALRRPQVLPLLLLPFVRRLRLMAGAYGPKAAKTETPQVCVLSRQRIVGRTNGSSTYLLDLIAAVQNSGFDVHYLSPSPATLGRWPFLRLSKELAVFRTIRIRGTWRLGRYLISKDPKRVIDAALAIIDRILLTNGLRKDSFFKPAAYPIAQSLVREDQLFVARHGRSIGDFLIADYCFLTDAFPFALRPESGTAVVMHDRFSSRSSQFDAVAGKDSVPSISVDEETRMLARANMVVSIQGEEADFFRPRLPKQKIIVAPIAASPVPVAQPGRDDRILFVGSAAAPNIDGLRWFLQSCWPIIRAQNRDVVFYVAGSVCQSMPPPPDRVQFLGFVEDLTPTYRDAGVIVSPLRVGSGLKIKLIEALGKGKAVVATSRTLQGVGEELADAVCVADQPESFATMVNALLSRREDRAALGQLALARVAEHFSNEACYGPFINAIKDNFVVDSRV